MVCCSSKDLSRLKGIYGGNGNGFMSLKNKEKEDFSMEDVKRSKLFLVRADVFGLVFPNDSNFKIKGISFIPAPPPIFFKDLRNNQYYHYATGQVELMIISDHWSSAINQAYYGILSAASRLLTFAQRRPIFFRNLRVEGEDYIYQFKGEGRIGLPINGSFRIRDDMLVQFLDEGINKLQSPEFLRKTHAFEAIALANEQIISSMASDELKFIMLWQGLEAFTSIAELAPEGKNLLSDDEFDSFQIAIQKWARNQNLSKDKSLRLKERSKRMCKRIERLGQFEKIIIFLKMNNIEIDEEEIGKLIKTRNNLSHDPWKPTPYLTKRLEYLDKLIGKSILSVLGLKPEEYLSDYAKIEGYP
jgi:hypothetical protein